MVHMRIPKHDFERIKQGRQTIWLFPMSQVQYAKAWSGGGGWKDYYAIQWRRTLFERGEYYRLGEVNNESAVVRIFINSIDKEYLKLIDSRTIERLGLDADDPKKALTLYWDNLRREPHEASYKNPRAWIIYFELIPEEKSKQRPKWIDLGQSRPSSSVHDFSKSLIDWLSDEE